MKLDPSLDKLFYSTIRLETKSSDGEYVNGTAFIYEYTTEDNAYPFLVTSRHLIMDASEGRITLIQGEKRNPIPGKAYTLDIENFSKLWFWHPDEVSNVAVTPFVPFVKHVENSGVSVYFQSLNDENLCAPGEIARVSPGAGAVYVGYPNSCWDRKHLLPVVKHGMMALPFSINYQNARQGLLDTRVVQGSSGSPVYLHRPGSPATIDNNLLGMLVNLPYVEDDQNAEASHAVYEDASADTEMGIIVKMDVVIEAITAYLKEKGFI